MSTADDTSGEQGGQHFSAGEDWPPGVEEMSWWPFVSAIGAIGLYPVTCVYIEFPGMAELKRRFDREVNEWWRKQG